MLATLARRCPEGPGWAFSRKLDGVRCIAYRAGGRIRLMSRNRRDVTASYPEVAEALLRGRPGDLVVDGEIVAIDAHGNTGFQLLQARRGQSGAPRAGVAVHYYAFDILYYGGYDVTRVPLADRRSLLEAALEYGDAVRLVEDLPGDCGALFREACARGWEGIIAKRAGGPYVHGRSAEWLKLKCGQGQELVIGGYTRPKGRRTGFGAILVGYYRAGRLVYAGKVGTGFSEPELRRLAAAFEPLVRATPPFGEGTGLPRDAIWLEPGLVAEVAFEEWTRDGKLRQPRYEGLRDDKAPEDVAREAGV